MSDKIEVSMEYPQGTDDAAVVTRVGDGLNRFELDPLSFLMAGSEEELEALPRYGDVVEAEEVGPSALRFVRVVQRARLTRFEFIVSKQVADSDGLNKVLSKVEHHRGHWERVMDGIVLIFLPEGAGYDPTDDIQQLVLKP